MISTILFVLAAAAVPDVTAGPALADAAKDVPAPIAEVTVFSDRARVTRRAQVELKAGIHTLRLPDLPGGSFLNTVRVGCEGARVLRVETTPVERERLSIDQVEKLIDQLEKLTDRIAALDAEAAVMAGELSLLTQVGPQQPVAEAERVGKALPPALPDMWKRVWEFLYGRKEAVRAALRKSEIRRRKLAEELAKVQAEVRRHDLGGFTDRKIQVLAIVESAGPVKAKLELQYYLPGASWIPTYDVHFDAKKSRVSVNTAGMVHQASGEDWDNVRLRLSTAIPGQGIDLPELLTWALGEKREFLPRPVAARMPRAADLFPPPGPQPIASESERRARRELLGRRLGELKALSSLDPGAYYRDELAELDGKEAAVSGKRLAYKKRTVFDFEDDSIEGDLVRPEGEYLMSRKKTEFRVSSGEAAPPPPPPRPMARPAPSKPMPPSPGYSPQPVVLADSAGYADEAEEEYAVAESTVSAPRVMPTSLGLFDPGGYRAPHFSDPNLPAVVAGGLDYIYSCPTRTSVPSTGKRLRVPLHVQDYPVKTFYEATPSLKTTAYLKAKVKNESKRPILQGTANIFVGKDFSGQGLLKTTGPGGEIDLPLGADENIRLLRKVVPETVTEGVFSKDDVTTYVTTIEVGNYKKKPVRILVVDQVPKTNNEDIEIELGKVNPKQTKGPDEDGILRWEIDIPAGQTRNIEFRYKVTRPVNWQLTQ